MQSFGCRTQFRRGLRATQPKCGEQRDGFARHFQHAADILRVAHDAGAAGFDHQRQRLQPVDRGLHVGLRCIQQRIAIVLLVAAGGQRVLRQRIDVGNGELLFNEHTEDAGFKQRQLRIQGGARGKGTMRGFSLMRRPARALPRPTQLDPRQDRSCPSPWLGTRGDSAQHGVRRVIACGGVFGRVPLQRLTVTVIAFSTALPRASIARTRIE